MLLKLQMKLEPTLRHSTHADRASIRLLAIVTTLAFLGMVMAATSLMAPGSIGTAPLSPQESPEAITFPPLAVAPAPAAGEAPLPVTPAPLPAVADSAQTTVALRKPDPLSANLTGRQSPSSHDERVQKFSAIYNNNLWQSSESRSGSGSTVAFTGPIREFLAAVFKLVGAKSFLDSPCGDCNWQWRIPGISDIKYTGVDIVPDVIIANAKRHADKPNMRFISLDLAAEQVPKGQFDVILCRDAIQHLPVATGIEIIQNFERSGAKYLVTNVHTGTNLGASILHNAGAVVGGFYYVDLTRPPFNLTRPLMYRFEGPDVGANWKVVALWELPALGRGGGTTFLPMFDKPHSNTIVFDKETSDKLNALGIPHVLDDSSQKDRLAS